MKHPIYPKLIWVQAISGDTEKEASTPLVVLRETDYEWIGFNINDREYRKYDSYWYKHAWKMVEEDTRDRQKEVLYSKEEVVQFVLTALHEAVMQQIGVLA